MMRREFRAGVLAFYGAGAIETEELLAYNQNFFKHSSLKLPLNGSLEEAPATHSHKLKFPLAPEPHVAAWEVYAAEARVVGAFAALKQRLVQLQFPIQEGISQTEAYRSATRKGVLVDGMVEATGLVLQQPEKLQLTIHQSVAGAIPVLLTGDREDFVALVQALTMRNQPKPVPASMGACIVAGFNNWDRVRQYRRQWEADNPANCSAANWTDEFQRLLPQKELYQDRFIVLSDGPYSNVRASDLGLSEPEWQRLSLTIRLEHECTHYFTLRLFDSARNNLLDELIADYRGIVAATGHYRADWFLSFLGLESFPFIREGGRLQNYRGQPPLSDKAFQILQALVKAAAENLERFDAEHAGEFNTLYGQFLMLMTLTSLTLEELASREANSQLWKILDQLQTTFSA